MRWFLSSLLYVALVAHFTAFDGHAAEITVQHTFSREGTGGFEPQAALLLATDGALYGTTLRGGAHRQGVIFKLLPGTTNYSVLHHFSLEKTNGRTPGSPLAEGKDGILYGATTIGGSANLGTVFKINKEGKAFTILHSFTGAGGDGRVPFAGVRQGKDGAWFGATDEGGVHGSGTLYRFDPDGTGYRVIHHFGGKFRSDGAVPKGTLCQASDGKWYGNTSAGGQVGQGTVFMFNGDGTGYRMLHEFAGPPNDAAEPIGDLIEATDGMLYGTSVRGGRASQGTVFRLRKDGTGFELIRTFMGLGGDGRNPYGGLVEGKDGTLYGVTFNGGAHASGLLFQLSRDGSVYKALLDFSPNGVEGQRPYAGLTLGPDGDLYGTTTGTTGSVTDRRGGAVFRVRTRP
jgi:uncharacterized repeat protein (TIGR03803 family)